jgi:hypothetical protein
VTEPARKQPLPDELRDRLTSIEFRYSCRLSRYEIQEDEPLQRWSVTYWDIGELTGAARQIGSLECWRAEINRPDLCVALDAASGDLEEFTVVLKVVTGELDVDRKEGWPSGVGLTGPIGLLIIESSELIHEWRGYGLGSYLPLLAIRSFAASCNIVATYPAPPGLEGAAREVGRRKLSAVAELMGFTRHRDSDVWIMPLDALDLSAKMELREEELDL